MTLAEAIEAFGQVKKIRRSTWPGGAYLQMQGAFLPGPKKEENFAAWLAGTRDRKIVDYFDGQTLSQVDKANLSKIFQLEDSTANWEVLD